MFTFSLSDTSWGYLSNYTSAVVCSVSCWRLSPFGGRMLSTCVSAGACPLWDHDACATCVLVSALPL